MKWHEHVTAFQGFIINSLMHTQSSEWCARDFFIKYLI